MWGGWGCMHHAHVQATRQCTISCTNEHHTWQAALTAIHFLQGPRAWIDAQRLGQDAAKLHRGWHKAWACLQPPSKQHIMHGW